MSRRIVLAVLSCSALIALGHAGAQEATSVRERAKEARQVIKAMSAYPERVQGQRPLRGFSGKDLEQELVIPGAATTLANQAVAGGVLLQKG